MLPVPNVPFTVAKLYAFIVLKLNVRFLEIKDFLMTRVPTISD